MVHDFVPTNERICKISLQPIDVHRRCKNTDLVPNRLTACKVYRTCGVGPNDEGMAFQLSIAAVAYRRYIHNATDWFTGKMAFCAVKHHSTSSQLNCVAYIPKSQWKTWGREIAVGSLLRSL